MVYIFYDISISIQGVVVLGKHSFLKAMILVYLHKYGEGSGYDFMKFCKEKGKNLAQKIVESRENLKEVFRKLGVTVGFDAPEFVEKRINSIFTALRKVNWEQKRNIEKLIKELEEFIEDLRRWNNEESH